MIEGRNIILRPFREDDIGTCFDLANNLKERGEFLGRRLLAIPPEKKKFQENGWWEEHEGRLLITDKQHRRLGMIGFFKNRRFDEGYEIGYGIFRGEDRGQGVGTEALRLMSAYLFEAKPIERLQLVIGKSNIASRRIAEKCGYQFEGTMRKQGFINGEYIDQVMYSLLRSECPRLAELTST